MSIRILIFKLAVILASISGCQQKADPNEIRIGFFPNITHAQALYGKHTNSFQDAFGDELTIKWLEFNAGPSQITTMFAEEVDIGYIGPIPAINAFLMSKGEVRVIAGASNGGAVMVTRPGLMLDSPSELDRLKIAIPQFGNTQHISLLNILKENNLATSDKGGTVEVMQAENPDIKTLLAQGRIDAALVPEPWGARLVNEIGATILLDEKQIWRGGDYPVAVVIVRMDFMEKKPELVKKFLETHVEITNEINSNPINAHKAIKDELFTLTQSSLEQTVLEEAFSRVAITFDVDIQIMNDFVVLLAEAGFTNNIQTQSDLVYTQMLDSVKKGTVLSP